MDIQKMILKNMENKWKYENQIRGKIKDFFSNYSNKD